MQGLTGSSKHIAAANDFDIFRHYPTNKHPFVLTDSRTWNGSK